MRYPRFRLQRTLRGTIPALGLALALGAALAPAPALAGEYQVQRGDSLVKIAARHDATWRELWRLNPQITNPNRIYAGAVIQVPDARATTSRGGERAGEGHAGPPTLPGMAQPPAGERYTVRSGDSLGRIAKRHGLTWAELWRLNPHITQPDRLRPGDVIRLPAWPESGQTHASVTAYGPTGRDTASGKTPRRGMAASNTLPFGTVVHTSAGFSVVIEDRIGCCSDLDIFMPTEAEARRFGRQSLRIWW